MSDWKTRLLVTSTGSPRPLLANAITAFREAPAWFGVLAYDEFSRETVIKAAPPWDVRLVPWCERVWTSLTSAILGTRSSARILTCIQR